MFIADIKDVLFNSEEKPLSTTQFRQELKLMGLGDRCGLLPRCLVEIPSSTISDLCKFPPVHR